jgi:hypothetical protein
VKPIILNADYMINRDEIPDIDIPTEIHFSRFGTNSHPGYTPNFIEQHTKKIFCHVNEPTTSRWVERVENVIQYHSYYDKIVTSNSEVLKNCSNSVFMPYGTTWLNKSKHHEDSLGKFTEDLGHIQKEFSLSMVCGSLRGKQGYDIRHAVFQHQNNINVPKNFYSSTRYSIPNVPTLPDDDKIHLFKSMYSIAIESTSEPNYFTEKLIDCLVTKTIPVYWGCPNIDQFFDTSYWIKIENIFDFNFTEEYYNQNIAKIESNFEKAKPYCENIFKRILEVV